jgi:C_GCAxxG_C_C family probable redox protein
MCNLEDIVMEKEQIALEFFNSGFNCSQAVLTSFAEDLGLNKETTLRIACGFGAGMGRLQETCGAVTGAYMVIGCKHGKYQEWDDEAKENTYAKVQEFSNKFIAKFETTQCKDLIKCDIRTEEGRKYFKENNINEKIC